MKYLLLLILSGVLLLAGCEHLRNEPKPSKGHITAGQDTTEIPPITAAVPVLPEPAAITPKEELHTLVVSDVSVRELLFSLARDTNLNLDIDENVDGIVTINAINQPFPAILDRIANSSSLNYSITNNVLIVRKDTPYMYNYKIDYLNMSRISDGGVSVSTQISSTGQGAGAEGAASGGGNNNSSTQVKNLSENNFWITLQKNISNIIGGATDQADNSNIVMNRESGVLGVRATKKQHAEVQRFLDDVQQSSQRQVLIEATIAEVKLSDRYQAGINWSVVRDATSGHSIIFDAVNSVNDLTLNNPPAFELNASKDMGGGDQLQSTLQALQTFGDVRIMSSPKIMALNNQTALLKVVDNLVYFTVDVNVDTATAGVIGAVSTATYETKINTVPVGFVMSVTPYINDKDSVTLNVRPTISRVISQMRDPNPALAKEGVISQIPVIQVREVESVLKINSGDVAIIGGLMQDEISNEKRGVPILSKLPVMGSLFRYDDDNTTKTELVIFIKPIVVKHASLSGDLKDYKQYLPDSKTSKKE